MMNGREGMADIVKKNIIMLGDGAVGKTSLIRRFVIDEFGDEYITTIGTKVTKREVTLEEGDKQTQMIMMIWDIIGQKGYRYTQSLSFRGMNGALLVADLTRKETLESLKGYWIPLVLKIAGPIPMVFLGNKADLTDEQQYGLEEIQQVASECLAFGSTNECYITSAKTGDNVETAFNIIAKHAKKTRLIPKMKSEWNLMDKEEVKSLMHVLDHIIADFSDQFGGIEHATPIIKHQMELSDLDLKKPNEVSVMLFLESLAKIESTFKTPKEVEENKHNRLKLFGYK